MRAEQIVSGNVERRRRLRVCSLTARRATLLTLLTLIFAGRAGGAVPAWLAPITQTAQPFIGVTHYQITQSLNLPIPYVLPRELSIHIVEIDPAAPGISFLGTPGNGALPHEYTRQTTSSFVNSNGLAVGINGDFYDTSLGINTNVSGLGMSNGVVVSPGVSGRPSFIVLQDNSAVVRTNGTFPTNAYNAVSGNQRLVQNGVNVTPNDSYTSALNPHTAIGVDNSNGHIFFMTVDGRQTNFSEGMRTDEMAKILIDFGVDSAINLDGGGSTTLVFGDGPGGAARTVNSPSDGSTGQKAGNERSVANHFGVYAQPNPDYVPLAPPQRPPAGSPDPLLSSITILEGFDGGVGRFSWPPHNGSGSTFGFTAESTATYTDAEAQSGEGSQQITLVRDAGSTARLRHVSSGGSPASNRVDVGGVLRAMAPQGYVGFFLKTTEPDLRVAIGLDDGVSSGTTGLEVSTEIDVIADGQWHLYEWNLADADQWSSFSNGNGEIDGPNAYLDSLFFYTGADTAGQSFTMFLDTVAYNPFGSLAALATDYLADFDGNWQVDAADLARWSADFGASAGSDADDDGDSDGADFLTWQRQFGNALSGVHAAAAIPEPCSLALAVLAAGAVRAGRWRRR